MTKERGLSLTGPDGLLKQFTGTVLATAMNEEMSEHLGHRKNQFRPDRKTTIPVDLQVPPGISRDREGEFEPKITCEAATSTEGR